MFPADGHAVEAATIQRILRDHVARAHALRISRRYDDAVHELRAALRAAEREGSPDCIELAEAASALGLLLEALGQPAEAEVALRLAIAVGERTCGPNDHRLAAPLSALGAVHQLRGDLTEAERLCRRALALARREHQEDRAG